MKKLMNSKFYLIGLLTVVALGAFLTFAYATNDNSLADKSDECLNKGEKSELALLKCGEAEGEKKCGEGKCDEAKKKECEEEKKCGEGDAKKCGEADTEDDAAAEEVEEEVEEVVETE